MGTYLSLVVIVSVILFGASMLAYAQLEDNLELKDFFDEKYRNSNIINTFILAFACAVCTAFGFWTYLLILIFFLRDQGLVTNDNIKKYKKYIFAVLYTCLGISSVVFCYMLANLDDKTNEADDCKVMLKDFEEAKKADAKGYDVLRTVIKHTEKLDANSLMLYDYLAALKEKDPEKYTVVVDYLDMCYKDKPITEETIKELMQVTRPDGINKLIKKLMKE